MSFADKLTTAFTERSLEAMEALYAPDALIDVNVPAWRFQRKGHDEILDQYLSWSEGPFTILSAKEYETPFGAVIETEDRGSPYGKEEYSRMVHLLFVEDGKVRRHVLYCTGPWDAETEARQKIEAPMYES
jgi:hypothetical protein